MHIHLIGICGTAMAALATLLKSQGHHISGSDADVYPPMSTFLEREGITIQTGFDPAHLNPRPDLVVIGNAISRGNPEVETVLAEKIRYSALPEVLKQQFLWSKRSLVVTGTHGKTTTSSLLAWVLERAGRDPSFFIGGIPHNFGTGCKLGQGPDFVLEGDEYDSAFFDKRAKFLHYLPDWVIINNLEFDHADIYEDLKEIKLAFRRLLNLIPRNGLLFAFRDDPNVAELLPHALCPVQTFGTLPEAQWRPQDIQMEAEKTHFAVVHNGTLFGTFTISLPGYHNVYNALAVIALAYARGLSYTLIREALATFQGVRRRQEVRGTVGGITILDDFAHHPNAVRQTLKALKQAYPKRPLWAVFEPRTATSIRRVFQKAYAQAFDDADYVILAPVFRPDKAPPSDRLSLQHLLQDIRSRNKWAATFPDVDAIVAYLGSRLAPGDLVVIMSNGAFDGIHDKLLQRLTQEKDSDGLHHTPQTLP